MQMSFRLICLTSTLCLLLVGCSAKYDNPVALDIGQETEIKCDLKDITHWAFKKIDKIVNSKKHSVSEDQKILKIHRSDYNDEGNYTCYSNSDTKTFVVKGRPRFKITSTKGRIDIKSIHANEGSDIDMICYIPDKDEIPKDERYSFVWKKGDKIVNALIENQRQYVLTIREINQSDRDVYSCVASNGILNHTESISLRVKDRLSYIWPLIGIVCEVVILVLTILIFEGRGVKPEYEESDNDANTDVKKSS